MTLTKYSCLKSISPEDSYFICIYIRNVDVFTRQGNTTRVFQIIDTVFAFVLDEDLDSSVSFFGYSYTALINWIDKMEIKTAIYVSFV